MAKRTRKAEASPAAAPRPERKAPSGTIAGETKRNDWQTPEHVLERVRLLANGGRIALDPATAPDNPTAAMRYCAPITPPLRGRPLGANGGEWVATDGLGVDWVQRAAGGLIYCNPPYGTGAGGRSWLQKIGEEARRGAFVVALLGVSRTEQPYLTRTLAEANAVCLIRGRVAFRNPDTGDLVSGGTYASWILGFNVPSFRRWRCALEPLAGTTTLQAKGERSACFELRAL